jgi:hypothetical protein
MRCIFFDLMKALNFFLLLLTSAASQAWPVYQLHEWGTFTTVAGSDGVLLAGLEREEEALPPFVHTHFGLENGQFQSFAEAARIRNLHGNVQFSPGQFKGLGRRPLKGVTVKMETPVIYFHSEEIQPFHANVKVGFEGGTISQWYPNRSGGEILPEPPPPRSPQNQPTPASAWILDFSKKYQGAIKWEIDVLPPAESRAQILFKPDDTIGWIRARQPMANSVRTSTGETEGYLFYRGVGNFQPGLKTTVDTGETLHLENLTGAKIPYLVVFELGRSGLRWTERSNGLDASEKIEVPENSLKNETTTFPADLYLKMAAGLAKCGLTETESRSMVETWWKSYFATPGLRVFWVLPRETTDRILPLEISPPPTEIVRVLVGRSEVLRPSQESAWLADSQSSGQQLQSWDDFTKSDRFGLAVKERIAALEKANPATAANVTGR